MRGNGLVILALLTALGAGQAWAQASPPRQPTEREIGIEDALLSKAVIGARVKNREGKDLGEIDQLVINSRTGQVSHVILGLGGLAGVGESKVVVAWKDLQMAADPQLPFRTIARVDQSVIERAPRWEGSDDRGTGSRTPSASPPTAPPQPGRPSPRY